MSEQTTVYLITGANKGIGLKLTEELLARPNTVVIATVRDIAHYTQKIVLTFNPAKDSKVTPIKLDSSSDTDFTTMISTIKSSGISKIDIIIANAGSATSYAPTLTASLKFLRNDFEVNTLGPIKLFQAAWPLLSKSETPKFFLMSSIVGSITWLREKDMGEAPALGYGMSKAAANYFTTKISVEFPSLISVSLHPGWVKTDMGQGFADAIGAKEAPTTLEVCVEKLLVQIDGANKDVSGKFLSYDGTILDW